MATLKFIRDNQIKDQSFDFSFEFAGDKLYILIKRENGINYLYSFIFNKEEIIELLYFLKAFIKNNKT